MSTPKKIILQAADNKEFEVTEAIAMKFDVIKLFLDENPDASVDARFPLPNVSSKCLSSIIEYLESHLAIRDRHHSSSSVDDEAKAYDEEFVKAQDNESLKEMMIAACYLNIKDLLDLMGKAIADRMKNKSVEYLMRFLGIENDYSAEEEAEIRAQNQWAFEGFHPDDD